LENPNHRQWHYQYGNVDEDVDDSRDLGALSRRITFYWVLPQKAKGIWLTLQKKLDEQIRKIAYNHDSIDPPADSKPEDSKGEYTAI